MFTITELQLNDIISNIGDAIASLMPLILLLLGIFIGVYILEMLVISLNPAEREEREIIKAMEGRLKPSDTLTLDEWKEVYRRKGREYRDWIGETEITEREFLEKYNKRF